MPIMSKYLRVGLLIVLCGIGLSNAGSPRAADLLNGALLNGQWALNPAESADQVHLMLMRSGRPGNTFTSGSDWNTADLKGLDLATAGKHDVRFTIDRDAGRFEADGFVSGAEGAGLFRFTPSPTYAAAMAAAGFADVEPGQQIGLALHDVSLAFAKEMKAQGLEDLDLRKLQAFRIHRVDLAYIKALRAQDVAATSASGLIALRIHAVTPEFAKAVRTLGYSASDKQLIALRVHDITPDYIAGLKAHGVEKLTLDKVISLKIHGIS
jgi:hypothetical protein